MNKLLQLNLSPIQQVIQLNDAAVPFTASVSVVSKTKAPFYMSIVDAVNLNKFGDNNKATFEKAEQGILNADVKNINSIWYLLLKSDVDNTVDVKIEERPQPQPTSAAVMSAAAAPAAAPVPKSRVNWSLIILIGLGVILLGLFIFNKFFKRGTAKVASANVNAGAAPIDIEPYSAPTYSGNRSTVDSDLLDKINNLPDL